jgi:NAD(P)-dependent dehydrogenase (short-subunit alcohol dehydrogenase family)
MGISMNIVITGASSGIGKILSDYFISKNHNVCKISRSKLEGFSIECDISNLESVQRSVDFISNHWTNVDCLICCAGTQWPIGPAIDVNPIEWTNNININLIGTYYTIYSFSKLMNKSKIICFSGGGSTSSRPNFSSYAVSKIGIVKLVEILAEELKNNVEINAISPGAFYTNMTKEVLSNPTLSGEKEFNSSMNLSTDNTEKTEKLIKLIEFLLYNNGITGKLISAQWDDLDEIKKHINELKNSDVYTLRRILLTDRELI